MDLRTDDLSSDPKVQQDTRLLEAELRRRAAGHAASCWIDDAPPLVDAAPETTPSGGNGAGATVGTPSLEIVYLNDRPPTPTSWAVSGILPTESCVIFGAEQKCGKSWLAFQLGVAMASGGKFLDTFQVHRPGRVLYYSPESGWEAKRRRLWGLCWGAGLNPAEVLGELPFLRGHLDLSADAHAAKLAQVVRELHPAVVVLDPFISVAMGVDENASGETQPVLNRIRDITTIGAGCSVVVAHHVSKAYRDRSAFHGLRGSTAMSAWADGLLSVHRSEDVWDSARRVDVEHRDDPSPAPVGYRLLTTVAEGAPVGTYGYRLEPCDAPAIGGPGRGGKQAGEAAERRKRLLALVTEKKTTSVQWLAEALEVSTKTISRYLDELQAQGKVKRDGPSVTRTEK